MASRSKKRRRVLGASCILAALIIAGSSFAWFTAKDEVTNRLSANADYDVKIVESFAPPANWLPGAEVNKDVYATNTGSVAAFVKETVSGVLTISNEKATTTKTDNSIELTEEERYAIEAGAFLAYRPTAANGVGYQIVVRPADQPDQTVQNPDNIKFDFTPTEEGLYVFRRSIDVNTETTDPYAADDYGAEVFTYDAYYFVPGSPAVAQQGNEGDDGYVPAADAVKAKYLKVSNLKVTEDAAADFAGDGVQTDGNLVSATGGFYEKVTDIKKTVDLTYKNFADDDADSGVKAGQYLVATYDTADTLGVDLNTDYEAAAAALDAARHEYELALELQQRAADESATADSSLEDERAALAAAKQALIDALDAQATALAAETSAKATLDRLNYEKDKLTARQETLETEMYGHKGGGTAEKENVEQEGDGKYGATSLYAQTEAGGNKLTEYTDAHDELVDEVEAWLATNPAGVTNTEFATLTYAELAQFTPSAELHEYYTKYCERKLAEEKYTALKAEYDANKDRLTTLGDDSTGLIGTATEDYEDAKSDREDADDDVSAAQDAYNDAYADFRDAVAAAGVATENLDTANKRLATARTKYNAALATFNGYDADGGHTPYGDSVLKIYIKLDNVTFDNAEESNALWQMLPAPVINDTEAVFYYTGMLEGGETSTKLIDSVYLDKRVTKEMYDMFDFDLNIDLDSVQVVQDENGRYIATPANEEFGADDDNDIDGANVAIKTPTSIDSALVWAVDAAE